MPIIYRRFITTKNGVRLDAHDYNLDVFRFWVDEIRPKKAPPTKEKAFSTELNSK
jgi:hypothetical protein